MKRIAIVVLLLVFGLAAQAQIIGATNRFKAKTLKENHTDKPNGWLLKAELGNFSSIAVGNQLSSTLMVGGGVGYSKIGSPSDESFRRWYMIPVFAQVRFGTPKYAFGLFVDLRVGVDFAMLWDNPFYDDTFIRYPAGQLMAGISLGHFSFEAGIQLNYNEEHNWYPIDYWHGQAYGTLIFSVNYDIMLNK